MTSEIVFELNGKLIQIPTLCVDPLMNLNEYLRTQTQFRGTKLGCGEGGCGACTVVLSRFHNDCVQTFSVVACLWLLPQCDGWSITTTEGLGNSKNGFHPIHERLSAFNGIQCGFCTPGFVMSIYAALKSSESKIGNDLTEKGIENYLDGNICRCTGYRSIVDTFKSFCRDHTVTDMVSKKAELGLYSSTFDPKFSQAMKIYVKRRIAFQNHGVKWIRPVSLKDVLEILSKHKVRLVAGNTSIAFDKRKRAILVDIGTLPELCNIELKSNGLLVGASVSLNNLARAINIHSNNSCIFAPLSSLIMRIASTQIRNVASIAGNLMMAKQMFFVSDLVTGLLVTQTMITLISKNGSRKINMDTFLASPHLSNGEMISSIFLPFTKSNHHYNTYKASIRQHNSSAFVNAAFYFILEGNKIKKAACAFGYKSGRSTQKLNRARKMESYLHRKCLTRSTLEEAIIILKTEIIPTGKRKRYKQNVMLGFFYRFFLSLIKIKPIELTSLTIPFSRPITSAEHLFKYPTTHAPVSEPIPQISNQLKASGEARFIDDYQLVAGTLYAAFITSKKANAKIISIDVSEALKQPGVVQYISAEDIPAENNYSYLPEVAPLLANKEVMFHGQPIGIIVADNAERAWNAAEYVIIIYDNRDRKPIISIEQAQEQKTEIFFNERLTLGKNEKNGKNDYTIKGNVFMNSQQHFYLETQISYCVPDEDGKMTIYCSMQQPAAVSQAVKKVLGIGQSAINVVHRRAGGAFGGKDVHCVSVACAAALAAFITGCPIKMSLPRRKDIALCGGREEVISNYNISFDKNGKISHVNIQSANNSGCLKGITIYSAMIISEAANQCYDWKNYDHDTNLFFTNTAPRTTMRGPGKIEASYIAETIIDHVSQTLNMPRDEVQECNFFPFKPNHPEDLKLPDGSIIGHWSFPRMWHRLKEKVNWESIKQEVETYNKKNRWRKKGTAITPLRHQTLVLKRQAMVNIYADGTVLITQDACDIGQGLDTKIVQVCAYGLGKIFGEGKYIPLNLIRIADVSSAVTPNAVPTGASTASEGSCEAVRLCCEQLFERLMKIKKEEEEEKKLMDPISWVELCAAANASGQHLSAIGHWRGAGEQNLVYNTFGAAATTVEIDVITGEIEILSSDLIYDCGKSLNPAIDIGQAEGAFVMGLGFYFTEEVLINKYGHVINNNTWNYKPPLASDMPIRFTVEFLENSSFHEGILSSKCSGEPPMVLATSAIMAVKTAIYAARSDAGLDGFFTLNTPATPADIAIACGTCSKHFTFPEVPLPRM